MIIWLQKFLHFSSFPFLAFFFFFTTVWCKKWANPFGLDLRPALNHKPSVFSSRQELKGWLFKSTLLNSQFHSISFITWSLHFFCVRCAHVPNTLSAVLALKTKSNTSKQKEIVVTYWRCEQKCVLFLLKMRELIWKLFWSCILLHTVAWHKVYWLVVGTWV